MRSATIRLTALLLALLMVFSVCGCKSDGGKDGTNEDIKPLEGETPVDLQGYEFTVADSSTNRWNREMSGTPFLDAWQQVMDEVETLYNCKITPTYIGTLEMFNTIQPEIAAGGKYADIIIAAQHEYGKFLGAGLMMDLNELDVNWENEWWNQAIRECTAYGGRSYVAGGSFAFDTAQTWILYYNEAIWDQHGFPDPYELVDSGKWTYDLFRQYCLEVAEDRDGSGAMDSVDDLWGLAAPTGDFCDVWFMSLGGHFFKTNAETGKIQLACNNERTYDIVDKMYTMVQKDKSVDPNHYESGADWIAQFVKGGTLFMAYTPGQNGLQDMEDDWGVLPLPKYDAAQEDYLSGVEHNARVFGVANTNQNTYETSILLEAIGRHAMILEDIYWPDYKETYWRHEEEDTRMIAEYVVGHGQHDIALIMAKTNQAFSAPRTRIFQTVYRTAGPDFASYIESVEDTIDTIIKDYFEYDNDNEESGEE